MSTAAAYTSLKATTEFTPIAVTNDGAKPRLLVFFGDWGYSRYIVASPTWNVGFDIEANLCRHPERQGKPNYQFSRILDLYTLGIIFLETGP
jgi:hypothetical protein